MRKLNLSWTLLPVFCAALLLWGLLLVLAQPAVHATGATPDALGTLDGTVIDGAGTPLAGIAVSLLRNVYEEPIYTLRTDSNGRYQFTLLPAGIYYLKFSDPIEKYAFQFYRNALLPVQAAAIIVAGTRVTAANVTLAPGGRITGTIALAAGTTYPEGQIELLHKEIEGGWQQVTASKLISGAQQYSLAGLPAGRYRLCVANECYDNVASGYENAADLVVTAGEIISNINFVLGDGADLAGISGQITGSDQKPLANITVQLWRKSPWQDAYEHNRQTVSDAEGQYWFNYLPPGVYKVDFSDPVRHYATLYYADATILAAAQPLTLTQHERRQGINTVLPVGGQLTGRVSAAGETAHRGRVYIYHHQSTSFYELIDSTAIDATGHYILTGLATDAYRLLVEAYIGAIYIDGYEGGASLETAGTVPVTAGLTTTYNIELTLKPDLFEGVITGTVTNAGTPLAGIKVEAYEGIGSFTAPLVYTYTNGAGHYQFGGLYNGDYYLRAVDPTYTYALAWHNFSWFPDTSRPLVISGSTPISNVNIGLYPAAAISGRVRQPDSAPASTLTVSLCVHFGGLWRCPYLAATTDEEGRYTFRGLPANTYRVGVESWPPKFYALGDRVGDAQDISVQFGEHRCVFVDHASKTFADLRKRCAPHEQTAVSL